MGPTARRRRHRRRLAALLAAVVGVLAAPLALSTFAAAQTSEGEAGTLQIREVDAEDPEAVAVTFNWSGDAAATEDLVLREDGEDVDTESVAAIDQPPALVLAVDVSEAMEGSALVETKAGLTAFLGELAEGTQVALVTFAEDAVVDVGFTRELARVQAAVDELAAGGPTALWNGVGTAAELLDEVPTAAPAMVLVSGGPDSGSATTASRARGAVLEAEASVYAVGTGAANQGALQALARQAGGTSTSAAPDEIPAALDETAALVDQQFRVVYARGDDAPNVADLSLDVGGTTAQASFVDGGVQATGSSLAPRPAAEPSGFAALQTEPFKLLAIVGTLVAVSLGVYALVMALTKDPSGLETVLSPYGEGYVPGAEGAADDPDGSLATSALLQRAVDLTEQLAERQGFLASAEAALERANLPLRAAEAMFFYAAFVLVSFVLGTLLQGILIGLIVAGVFALLGPAIVSFLAGRRRKQFMAQLPDMLTLLSGTLRAGYSLMQGVEAVAQEVDEPMGQELRRIVTEARLGRPLEEALDGAAERLDIADFTWAVMAIRIQREVGGNLAELLLTVADTMTQRERLRRDVAALTAEGKMSAIVLGILPPALAAVMWVVNPEYIGRLFNTTIGNVMLGFAVVLAGFGFWWMKKTIEIEI